MQITVAETVGVEGRGEFYDETGALRDIVQNHVLQLLAVFAMEPPVEFAASDLRDEKLKVLRAVRSRCRPTRCAQNVVRGQYVSGWVEGHKLPAYREEPEVRPDSEAETFVALKLEIGSWRWAGVPFYLRTGKALPTRVTEVAVQFKQPPLALFERAGATQVEPNILAVRVQPDEGILLRFGAKVPGPGHADPQREHGLPVRLQLRGRLARCLRDAAAGRHGRRSQPLHPQRRGRAGVGDPGADPERLGGRRGWPTALLRRRLVGSSGGR